MGTEKIQIIRDIKELILGLISYKKKARESHSEYYVNKSIKSIFYVSQEEQNTNVINKRKKPATLPKPLIRHTQENDDNFKQDTISIQSKHYNQNIIEANNQLKIQSQEFEQDSAVSSKTKDGSDRNINSTTLYDTNKPECKQTKPGKLNPKLVQDLENIFGFQVLKHNDEEQKIKQPTTSCGAEANNILASSTLALESTSISPSKQEAPEPVVVAPDANCFLMPPPPPPIEGFTNFKGPKFPSSFPIQDQSKVKQDDNHITENKSDSKLPVTNDALVIELALALQKRKNKALSI